MPPAVHHSDTNLAGLVLRHAQRDPDRVAMVIPTTWTDDAVTDEVRLTYGELAGRVAALRAGLAAAGFVEGDRVVVMFPVRVELYVLVLALLASGMVPVFVDTGMGSKRVLHAVKLSRARAIVSVDALLKHRLWLPALWGRRRYAVDRSRWGVRPFEDLVSTELCEEPARACEHAIPALITFTSGSTGRPKGADRTHDLLIAQHHALAEHFPAAPDEIDMPCFPVVTLHNLCSGITTVMPAVDLSAPATVQPAAVVGQIRAHGVTRMTGATAYLTRIAEHLAETGDRVDSVRQLGAGGAPVPRSLCTLLAETMPTTEGLVIYGSTEAEPLAAITMKELLATPGDGYLVGRPAPAATIVVVALPHPPPTLDARQMAPFEVATGGVGELVVRGPHVLRRYVDDPQANAETKLQAPDGGVWHRTGDVGRVDEQGRIWLLGRVKDAIPRPVSSDVEGQGARPPSSGASLSAVETETNVDPETHSQAASAVFVGEPGASAPGDPRPAPTNPAPSTTPPSAASDPRPAPTNPAPSTTPPSAASDPRPAPTNPAPSTIPPSAASDPRPAPTNPAPSTTPPSAASDPRPAPTNPAPSTTPPSAASDPRPAPTNPAPSTTPPSAASEPPLAPTNLASPTTPPSAAAAIAPSATPDVLHPFPVEAALDALPGVARSAIVAHRLAPHGEVLVEISGQANEAAAKLDAVRTWLQAHDLGYVAVAATTTIPMDPRHNSKIDRPTLRARREKR